MNITEIIQNLKAEIGCVLILAVLWYKSAHSIYRRNTWGWFTGLVTVCLFFTISSAANSLVDHGLIQVSQRVNYVLNLLYFFWLDGICYLWFLYSEHAQKSLLVEKRSFRLVHFLPMAALLFCTVLSCWTRQVFYVDENGVYQRGPLYLLQFFVPYTYIMFTSFKAFYKSFQKEYYLSQYEYRSIAKFMVAPLFFSWFQLFFPDTLTLSLGMTLATLLVYLNSQETLISLDPLTRLNNRTQLLWYLSQKMKSRTEGRRLYLMMMDVDEFKKINDQHGHVEGDGALVQIAEVLKRTAAGKDCFIARYGGDEFILVCEMASSEEVEDFCRELTDGLSEENQKGAAYKLSLSIGYAAYTEHITSIPDFIKAADRELYRVKKAKGARN